MAFRILIYCVVIFTALHSLPTIGVRAIDLSLRFVVEPQHITVLRGQPLTLNCSAFSNVEYGPVNITWQFEGQHVNDARRHVLPNGSLHFEKVINQRKRKITDEGWYACVATNNVGILISRLARLTIANISEKFALVPKSTTTAIGDVARFSCQIKAVPDALISWERDRQPLTPDDRIVVLSSGVLQIHNVKNSDAGRYRCIASNIASRRRSSTAQLTVIEGSSKTKPPSFLSPPSGRIFKNAGKSAILECLASENIESSLTWIRDDGKPLPSDRISKVGRGTLVISSLLPEDSGTYTCTMSTKHPETGGQDVVVSQSTELRVLVPPKIVVKPENIAKPMSIFARFKCNVEGIPTPTVMWLKDGQPLKINGRIKTKGNSVLIVAQTVTTDSGIYQCLASNRAGTSTAAARLHVKISSDQPLAPYGLVASTVSSSSILIQWKAPLSQHGLPIQAYSIHCLPTNGGAEIQKVAANTSQLFTNLVPFTNYTFYVRAYNDRSASPQSKTVRQVTGEDVPNAAPTITVTSKNPSSMFVSWSQLSRESARGYIVAYKIYYRRNNEASHNIIDVIGKTRQYTITDLQSGGVYDVRVLAGTKLGFPVLTDFDWPWVNHALTKFEYKQVPDPPELFIRPSNSSTITLNWESKDVDKEIEGYKLYYRKQSHPLQGPVLLSNSTNEYVLKNLEPYTWYEIHLLSYNIHGVGPEAVRNILTQSKDGKNDSMESVPPPNHLEGFPISKSTIRLVWQPPTSSQLVSYYTVSYHIVQTINKHINPKFLTSKSSEVLIADLKPYTLYEFSVQSHNSKFHNGPFSQKVQCRTKEDVPTEPIHVNGRVLNENTYRVIWEPPRHPNGLILKYHVLYNTKIPDLHNSKFDKSKSVVSKNTSLVLSNLKSNVLYYVVVSAETSAGIGPGSSIFTTSIPVVLPSQNTTTVVTEGTPDAASSKKPENLSLGIIVGISIGVICIVLCVVVVLCSSRCCPPSTQPINGNVTYVMCKENGYGPVMNGNGYLKNGKCREMKLCKPMLMTTIANGSIPDDPLDTKGGYPAMPNNGSKPANHCNGINGNSNHKLQFEEDDNSDEAAEVDDDVAPKPSSQADDESSNNSQHKVNQNSRLDVSSTPLLSVSQCSQELTTST